MTPLDFRVLAVAKNNNNKKNKVGGQHVTTWEEIFVGFWPLFSSPLAPDYYSVFSRKVPSHLLKKEPTDLLDDSSGANPQYNLALSLL